MQIVVFHFILASRKTLYKQGGAVAGWVSLHTRWLSCLHPAGKHSTSKGGLWLAGSAFTPGGYLVSIQQENTLQARGAVAGWVSLHTRWLSCLHPAGKHSTSKGGCGWLGQPSHQVAILSPSSRKTLYKQGGLWLAGSAFSPGWLSCLHPAGETCVACPGRSTQSCQHLHQMMHTACLAPPSGLWAQHADLFPSQTHR